MPVDKPDSLPRVHRCYSTVLSVCQRTGRSQAYPTDKNCITLPDGSCIGTNCMHDIPPRKGGDTQ